MSQWYHHLCINRKYDLNNPIKYGMFDLYIQFYSDKLIILFGFELDQCNI